VTLEALERAVADCPEIVECFSISGSSDYVCRIVVESIARYEHFLKKTLLHLPGVSEVNSEFALKRADLLAERWLGDVQACRRAMKVQLLGDREEVAEVAQLHG